MRSFNQKLAIVTGGGSGMGRELVLQLAAQGCSVATCDINDDSVAKTTAMALADAPSGVRVTGHVCDVSDEAQVLRFRDEVVRQHECHHVDLVFNNAGIAGGRQAPADVTAADVQAVYDTNVFGVVRVTHAFLPLLQASDAPVIVNVSSGLGSLAVTTNPERMESRLPTLAYSSSKAAVNMLTSQYAKAFPAIIINVVDPGYTATDLNANSGTQTIGEGAEVIVRMAQIGPDGPTGAYFDRHGTVPW